MKNENETIILQYLTDKNTCLHVLIQAKTPGSKVSTWLCNVCLEFSYF